MFDDEEMQILFPPPLGDYFLTEPKEGEIKYFLKKLFPSPLGDYFF